LSDVLQGRQRPRDGAHARSCLTRNYTAARGFTFVLGRLTALAVGGHWKRPLRL
ncbi:hypothetical protein DFO61_5234, partial [Ectopseudomonas oleovorans]